MPIEANCPGCRAKVRVPDSLLGKRVKCPKCTQVFVAEDPNAGFEEVVENDPPPRRNRPALVEDDEQYDDDEIERRPRRRGSRRAAEAAVKGPAIALLVVGGMGLVVGLLNLVLTIAGKGQMVNMQNQQVANQFPGLQITAAVLPVVWGIIVPYGGFKMLRLENRSSVMIAVVFAMLPCSGCCVLGLPFAIWALVVLNRPEVQRAFSS